MITRTPLRVSLFGGGTDYPEYFERRPGAVVGFAIDKYIFIAGLQLDGNQPYNYRVSYSALERVDQVEEIRHPVVRETLKHMDFGDRLDISIMSELPASGSGLGSSSAFTVGFVHLVNSLQRRSCTKIDLARQAIRIEREILRENVGVQDQLHATFGGINRFDFEGSRISITPLQVPGSTLRAVSDSLVLVHTGIARRATEVVADQVQATRARSIDRELGDLYGLVAECVSLLESEGDEVLPDLGRMLSESWAIKRKLSDRISNQQIDELYDAIMRSGAYGAKLCGAGGGGYFLALVRPELRQRLTEDVAPHLVVPIRPDIAGSTLVYPTGVETNWR